MQASWRCGASEKKNPMRRSRHIILNNLPRNRPAYTTRPVAPSNDYGSRFALCALIAGAVGAFFWLYGAMAYHQTPWVPLPATASNSAFDRAGLVAPNAPAPDMRSAAIKFANADVPREQEPQKEQHVAVSEPAETKHEAAAPAPPKKKVHVAKPLPAEAANAYASEARYSRPEIGALGSF